MSERTLSSDAARIVRLVREIDDERCEFRSRIAALEAENDRLRALLFDAPFEHAGVDREFVRIYLDRKRYEAACAALEEGGDDE